MISSLNEEEAVIKWLLAETIIYQNQKHLWFKSDWVSHTGIHKTLFNIFEKFDVPITRSWYLYGGYIHSDLLIGKKFSLYRNDYTRHPDRVNGLRREIRRIRIPIGEMRESLTRYVDEIFSQSVDSYLRTFYEDAPEKLKSVYKAKHELGGYGCLVDKFKSLDTAKYEDIKTNILKIYERISEFHLSTLELYKDEELENLNWRFSNLLEEPLRKLELIIVEKRKISKVKLRTLAKGREIFDEYVWKPYACQISHDTVKGLRAKEEKSRMMKIKQRTIKESSSKFDEFSSELQRRGLNLTVNDTEKLHSLKAVEDEFEKSLQFMINVYKKSKE